MDKKVKGIILKAIDYKESDKLLTILTLEEGKILVVAKGVKKAKSKFKAYCQPFCFADFELSSSKGGGAYILTGVNCIESFFDLTSDINKFDYGFCLLEINDKICKEGLIYPQLLLSLLKTLQALTNSQNLEKLCLIKFILGVLNFEGVSLNLNKCANCKTPFLTASKVFLNMQTCEILCSSCQNLDCIEIERSVFSTLKIISETDFNKLNTIKIKVEIINKTICVLVKNLEHKFEIKLKSMDFIK